jgi:hypothetical protein
MLIFYENKLTFTRYPINTGTNYIAFYPFNAYTYLHFGCAFPSISALLRPPGSGQRRPSKADRMRIRIQNTSYTGNVTRLYGDLLSGFVIFLRNNRLPVPVETGNITRLTG